jgi:hypothetical protein
VLQNGQADGEVHVICRFSCSAVEPATLLKSRRMEVLTGLRKAKKPRLWSGQFDGGNRGEGYAVDFSKHAAKHRIRHSATTAIWRNDRKPEDHFVPNSAHAGLTSVILRG